MTTTSEKIRNRILQDNGKFFCNDNISSYLEPDDFGALIEEVSGKMQGVLESLVIDTKNDHNTQDTAHRVAKMFCTEIFSGRYLPQPKITAFPNVTEYDQVYVTGPISIRSTCAHHFQSIKGKAYVGVFPGKNVIGLSKFNRMVDWIVSRPQIQEEMTIQIADLIEQETQAQGVAVLIQAEHGCMTMRGVREHESDMTTSVMRGAFREHPHIKQEFFNIVARMK
jgi:GTP cyclohydrolase I